MTPASLRGITTISSLKARLGLGSVLLGAGTLLTAFSLYYAMTLVAERLDAVLASEARIARYAILSRQTATFLVVATETVQTGQPVDVRMERLSPVNDRIRATLELLQADIERAVDKARALGVDEQSRYGTQSLGIARMGARLDSTLRGLADETADRTRLRAHLDGFAASFDPLLNEAVNTEALFRSSILSGIERLRRNLTTMAIGIAALTLLLLTVLYFGLIHPQFRRLDQLRTAASRIGREDFDIALPESSRDEIGQLYAETNRMAAALQKRRDEVKAEWSRLNEVIAQRTEDLRTANAKLEAIDDNRRRLFADISHELRTPLTVISMEAQLGLKGAPDPEGSFRTIASRSSRLNRRIDDLLRVAQSDSGQIALDIETVELSRIAREVVEEVGAELDNAGMQLELGDMPEGAIRCDMNWLRQTIVSLLRNTIRHARAGKRVGLSAEISDGTAGFHVIDNGPGIAESEQDRMFDRFAQGGQGNSQGFGVGLALARWVTEAQEGDIELVSPVPRTTALGNAPGTMVTVRLPRADRSSRP
ncbi:MAG: HAMP domain-containing sensor histidine kinase [Pseudomonadota bacterium]